MALGIKTDHGPTELGTEELVELTWVFMFGMLVIILTSIFVFKFRMVSNRPGDPSLTKRYFWVAITMQTIKT